jgi:hypothetical protein
MACGCRAPEPISSSDRHQRGPASAPRRPGVPGKAMVTVYSCGAIGRLVPEGVIGLAPYLREHAATS